MRQVNIALAATTTAFAMAAVLASAVPSAAREARFSPRLLAPTTAAGSPMVCPAAPAPPLLAYRAPSSAMPGYSQGVDMRSDEGYNTDYLFVMTRSVAASSVTPAVKPILFLFTVPLDIVFLPFAAIGGLF
jgi:hypothetical protein